jgi:hypothetical protein
LQKHVQKAVQKGAVWFASLVSGAWTVFPTGRNFGRKTHKHGPIKYQRPEETAEEFYADFSKNDRKVA